MISLPRTDYASLSSVLPRMASAEVQRSWTGSDGANLLAQTFPKTSPRYRAGRFPLSAFWILVVVMGAFCARCCILAILLICTAMTSQAQAEAPASEQQADRHASGRPTTEQDRQRFWAQRLGRATIPGLTPLASCGSLVRRTVSGRA